MVIVEYLFGKGEAIWIDGFLPPLDQLQKEAFKVFQDKQLGECYDFYKGSMDDILRNVIMWRMPDGPGLWDGWYLSTTQKLGRSRLRVLYEEFRLENDPLYKGMVFVFYSHSKKDYGRLYKQLPFLFSM